MKYPLSLLVVTGIFLVFASCSAPDSAPATPPDDLFSAISTGDHRILDDLDPSDGSVEALRSRRPDGPYILGRALERRGRDAAARLVYQAEVTAGVSRWAGLSAVRLAVLSTRQDDLSSAQGHAQRAVDVLPEFRDGWMALGTAMYRREEYSALLELVDRLPPSQRLAAGERVSVTDLYGEAALWRAVSAWETGNQPEAAFRRAFIGESVQPIHERLFLYLFYRNNASNSFSPVVRLLMESIYRQERGESREALRLITMIEPEALLGEVEATVGERAAWPGWKDLAELGVWDSLEAMVRDSSDTSTRTWIARLRTEVAARADEDQFRDLLSIVDLIAAEAAVTSRAGTAEVIDRLTGAADHADSEELRRRIAQRLVTFSVDRERSLAQVVDDLQRLQYSTGTGSFPDAYAIAADRLLPQMVQERSWRELALLLPRIPEDARIARNRVLFILVHAAEAGLLPSDEQARAEWQDELSGAVESLSAIGYTGMVGRVRAGLPLVDAEASENQTAQAVTAADSADPEVTAPPRELDVAHAEALVLAGDSRSALAVAMRAARSAPRADDMLAVATLMAELGHTSDALDVARRAVSRAELPLTTEIVELIYPMPFRAELQDAADRHGVPVYLLTALVREESHFRPIARSPVGAQGLGQIMPATGDDIRRRMDWPEADVSRPADNLLMSAYYLDYLAGQIESPVLRLAAYNAGLGRGRRWQRSFGDLPPILQVEALPFVETRWYLRRITVSHAVYRHRMLGTELEAALGEFMEGAIW